MFRLKPYRSQAKGVADLLAYAALWHDGVVMTKGGGLIGGYFFRGPDITSATAAQRNTLTARVNAALARLGDGWVTWTDCFRLGSHDYPDPADSSFPDPISRLIDDERRRHFRQAGRHYESEFALILMYTPPLRRTSKIADMVYEDDAVDNAADPGPRLLQQFERALADIEDSLYGALRLQRMTSYTVHQQPQPGYPASDTHIFYDELVNYLNFCLSGDTAPLQIPSCPMYLDAYLGGQELWTGDTPRYGDKFICCVHIEGFPSQAYPNILGFLDSLPLTYRWSTRFIYLDRHTALKELNRYRRQWRQKTRGFFQQVFRISSGQINEDALLMAKQADTAITDAQSAVVTFGYYSSVVVLMGEERQPLDEQARVVVRELRRQGFNGRKETINTLQSWLGTLAGHPEPNVRRPLLHTLNLSDLMPLSGVWAGRAVNPCPLYPADSPPLLQAATTGNTPFRLNLHVSDVGHTLIFGPTGAGKSTLLCLIMAQFLRYPGGTIAAFDNGRSMFALCHAVGGRFYDLGAGRSDIGFAPLQYLDNDNDVAWAAEWITTCFELQAGHRPSPRQKEAINRALKLLRESPEGRSLTDFTASLQDAEVRDALRYYTLDGPLGQLLDSREDGLQEDRVQVFEMSELMGLGPATLLPVMLYLFRRIDKMAHGQPGLLPVDEAWLALGHPVFREKLRDWFKKKRKENWAIVPATQSLSDATRSGILDVLMESCPTKIFLPNEEADKTGTPESPGPNELYRMFGLNEVEIELIRTAQKKRHYYYTSPEGHRLFDLALGPIALSFVGISSAEDIARIRQLMDEHRDHWPFAWLKERGIADEPRAA